MTLEQMAKAEVISALTVLMKHAYTLTEITDLMNTVNRGPVAGSIHDQIAKLNPGECFARARPLDPTLTVDRCREELPAIRQQVRNSIAAPLRRAKETTGATYSVEVGDVVMPNGTMYVVAVVSRTA